MTGFHCSCCGKWHDELPLDYGVDVPDLVFEIPPSDRKDRIVGDSEFCVIDEENYFVRGIIEIPILGREQTFNWGVWVSLSEKNFKRMIELLESHERAKEPPYFGWLCTALPYPETTIALKTMVHSQPVGLRPKIQLEPTSHPLALEQKQGITIERVQQIAEGLLHG